jgi:hypothetical protein
VNAVSSGFRVMTRGIPDAVVVPRGEDACTMKEWTTRTTVRGLPDEVLTLLTDPKAIATWSPVPFEITELDGRRLKAGSRARVRGSLAGKGVEFDVKVEAADECGLTLRACGPVDLDVAYELRAVPEGSDVRARVAVRGRGILGRVLATATESLLAAGALDVALNRMGGELATV